MLFSWDSSHIKIGLNATLMREEESTLLTMTNPTPLVLLFLNTNMKQVVNHNWCHLDDDHQVVMFQSEMNREYLMERYRHLQMVTMAEVII